MSLKVMVKRSFFLIGLVRAFRGLHQDTRKLGQLIVRRRMIRNYLQKNAVKKLHLGASNSFLNGWLNTDVFPNRPDVVYLDATGPFPFDDGTFDYIMAEHMIEHVDFLAGQRMLRECYRVLKPGGRVRFATPDLRTLLGLHSGTLTSEQEEYLEFMSRSFTPEATECKSVFVINNSVRAWGHQFLYDDETLRYALRSQKFQDIAFYKSGASHVPELTNIETHGQSVPERVNSYETIVVEATKR